LHSNFMGPEACIKLAEVFAEMPQLREVNLSNNAICGVRPKFSNGFGELEGTFTLDAINAFCAAMPKCNLASIDLDNNFLTGGLPYNQMEGITAICEALPKSNVTSLSLSSNSINNSAAAKLAEAFAKMPSLTSANLANNNITIRDEVQRVAPNVDIKWD